MRKLRLAIAQIKGHECDRIHNQKRVMEMMERAYEQQADYLVFPELYLSGYSRHSPHHEANAMGVQNPLIQEIGKQAGHFHMGVIVGMVETDGLNLYNTAVLIDKRGKAVGFYRKIHLFEYERNMFSPGRQLPVFELPEVKLGILIAHDMEYPEAARVLALKGAELLIVLSASTFSDQQKDIIYLRGRAMENHLFVVSANKVGLEEHQLFLGESKWIHPSGDVIHACSHNEELAVQEINLSEIEGTKGALDYLKNRRPVIYAKEGLRCVRK